MSKAIPLLPLWAFGACYRVNFTFTYSSECILTKDIDVQQDVSKCVLHVLNDDLKQK
jgi:hypothetical protein